MEFFVVLLLVGGWKVVIQFFLIHCRKMGVIKVIFHREHLDRAVATF